MKSSATILDQFNNMKNTGFLVELEHLKKENRVLERIIDDIYCLISYTEIDDMLDFVVTKILDYFIPQFLAFIIQPPRKTALRQYCYQSMQASDEKLSYNTYSVLANYFENTITPEYDYSKILNGIGEDAIPEELKKKEPVIIMPLQGIGGGFGIIILSEKTLGTEYTEQERQYILHLFRVLSLTIQNGLHYESSITEPKTNLFTPDYFDLRLNDTLALAKRQEMQAGVLMLDIDYFKNFNDKWGHLAGDKILIAVAKTLKKLTRVEDCVARFGGEEFIILLLNCNRIDLFNVAERMRIAISNLRLTERKKELSITISIGGYHIDSFNDLRGKKIIEKADQAMYESKKNGRNKTTIHSLGLFRRAFSIEFDTSN
ncbi:MAG TPA: GGDEF domain-containing protein [Treponemataceae bacterium]|nr:GGDEF domain-containing protein [Treponemataceae bacterium]